MPFSQSASLTPMETRRNHLAWCLLIVFGGLGVWFSWPGNPAVATIERVGGTVQILTNPDFAGAIAVTLPDSIGDKDLEQMTALDRLRPVWLQLRGPQISGRGLACLKRLATLRGLTLHGTSIADDDLIHLQAFPQLGTLN